MFNNMLAATKFSGVRVVAVIVLYKNPPQQSASWMSLQATLKAVPEGTLQLKVLLYDNTPGGQDPGLLPAGVLYQAAGCNGGLAEAYNQALQLAEDEGYDWLLTLDQDTMLPTDYLSLMSDLALHTESDDRVAAIVPQLLDFGRHLSPVSIRFWGVSYFPQGFEGISRRVAYAFNSASLFRVKTLKQIGGFNPYFWLDYLDAYVYWQLYRHGRNMYVAGSLQVEHELSLLHGENLNPDRFRNFLQAESAFYDLYGGHIRGLALTGRLLGRILRHYMRRDDFVIRQLTWNALNRRVFYSRALRIQDWKSEMAQRIRHSSPTEDPQELAQRRPAISVCMAAYNGARYITVQLQSILSQLTEEDEVIVVDDASTDGTRECVRSLRDSRIRLIEHPWNLGVMHSFEDAIYAASKGLIFLSDQDDLWVPDKVSTIIQQFQDNPSVTLVASDAAPIDQDGNSISESYFKAKGKFHPGIFSNLIRNSYIGCTLAFRANCISEFLPFPHRADVLHDIWIGVRNSLSCGQTAFIDRPLILYRRHPDTLTGRKSLTFARRVRVRFHLLLALIGFSISKRIRESRF
jgi:GT2 family glycosyltransferase